MVTKMDSEDETHIVMQDLMKTHMTDQLRYISVQ